MRVGVVCEGPTDFFAIRSFFGHALGDDDINAEFVPIQPESDNMYSDGGWTNVLLWLKCNCPANRIKRYFGGGLFEGSLGEPPLDAILIQLDSDILGEPSFTKHVCKKYKLTVGSPDDAQERADEVREVLRKAAKLDEMTECDIDRHVIAPAVESIEAWYVAAFTTRSENFELLSGQELINKFMSALEKSEGRTPSPSYAKIDKTQRRREQFLAKHAQGSARVKRGCRQFNQAYQQLNKLAKAV